MAKKLYKELNQQEKDLTRGPNNYPANAIYQLKVDCEQDGSLVGYCDGDCSNCSCMYVVPVEA